MLRSRMIASPLPAILLVASLTGCSGPDLLNALVPEEGYERVAGLPYGEGPRRRLDLYVPERPLPGNPTVVFLYGGSWDSGAREDYRFVGEAFASRGYQAVVPDYRVYPEVRYPAFLADSAEAVARVGDLAARHGREPGALHLVGHSAGAYNAAMLALDPRWLEAAGTSRCRVASFAGLAGPYDFLPLSDPTLMEIFAPADEPRLTQPIEYVDGRGDGGAPPTLLVSGLADETVDPDNSRRLAARLREAGVPVEERYLEGVGHVRLVAALGAPLRGLAPVLDTLDGFLRGRQARPCAEAGLRSPAAPSPSPPS